MHAALSFPRLQTPKAALRGSYSAGTGRVQVRHPRGTHFRTMGAAVRKGDGADGGAGAVMLNEEEALYLVERGALELRFAEERWEGGGAGEEGSDEEETEEKVGGNAKEDDSGLPMSVQAAYTFLIGAGHGLTLERFIVYAGLKRSGYIVLRAPGWGWEEEHDGRAGGNKSQNIKSGDGARIQPLGWFSRIYKALWESLAFGGQRHHHRPGAGPLVGLGVYRSYSQYYLISKKSSLRASSLFWVLRTFLRERFVLCR